MAFTFLRSYQPDTEHPDDEEEDEMPMARSGSVRAFSHLPDRAEAEKPEDAPPPQVVVGRNNGTRPYNPMPVHADEMPMARSGSVRAFSHLPEPDDGQPQRSSRSLGRDSGDDGQPPPPSRSLGRDPGYDGQPPPPSRSLGRDPGYDGQPPPPSRSLGRDPGYDGQPPPPSRSLGRDPDAEAQPPQPSRSLGRDPDAEAQPPEEWEKPTRDSGFEPAAPPSPRTSGLMMRPRPMPPEYARRQALGRMANSTPYGDERAATEADAPPETQDLDDPTDQRGFPQDNLPPETAPNAPIDIPSRWLQPREAPGARTIHQRGNSPTVPSSSQGMQQFQSTANPPNTAQKQGGGRAISKTNDFSGPVIKAVDAPSQSNSGNAEKIPDEAEYALKFVVGTFIDGPLNTAVAIFGGPGKYSYNPNPVRRAWHVDGILPKIDRKSYNQLQDGAEMLTFALAGAINPKNRVQIAIPAPPWRNGDGSPLSKQEAGRWFNDYRSKIAKTGSGEFELGIKDNKIISKLNNGTLNFEIGRQTSDGMLSGKDMFKSMMKFYGSAIKAIQGNWLYGDNLSKVNELTKGGTPLESAIKMTWTGLLADEHGFSNVEINYCGGEPGKYTDIQVTFRKKPNL
jgi:hypothetical protein